MRITIEKDESWWQASSRIRAASYDGRSCAICERGFGDTDVVWRVFIVLVVRRDWPWRGRLIPAGRVLASVCANCRDIERWPTPVPSQRCGNCARKYVMPYCFATSWRYHACCQACQDEMRATARNARRRQQRAEARLPATCVSCGTSITGRRRGASYCSNACRQRAYRDRGRAPRGAA
jgi:hypothetical protein